MPLNRSPEAIGALAVEAQRLIAAGLFTQAEAEGALLAALNYIAPDDAGAANERYMAQMPPDFKAQVEGLRAELAEARAAHLERARAALLAVSDEEWRAAGGT